MAIKKEITKEQYEQIKYQEFMFDSAWHHNYMHSPTIRDMDFVYDVYDYISGNKHARNYTCSHCQIELYRIVAPHYFKAKEKYINIENAKTKDNNVSNKATRRKTAKANI